MLIFVDTREQLSYWHNKHCVKQKLNVGDYTTEALFNKFHIERKSPQDLYGTLTRGNVRFRKELLRAKLANIQLAVFVESSRKNFVMKKFPRGSLLKFSSVGLDKMLITFTIKYCVEWIWCDNRNRAKTMVKMRLKQEEQNYGKK